MFKDFLLINIKFSIAKKKIIYFQKISIMIISFLNNKSITLLNIAFILKCKLNLIFFSQLQKTGFTYYDKFIKMILIKKKKVVTYTRQNRNFFILDFIKLKKFIIVNYRKPIYIINKNK